MKKYFIIFSLLFFFVGVLPAHAAITEDSLEISTVDTITSVPGEVTLKGTLSGEIRDKVINDPEDVTLRLLYADKKYYDENREWEANITLGKDGISSNPTQNGTYPFAWKIIDLPPGAIVVQMEYLEETGIANDPINAVRFKDIVQLAVKGGEPETPFAIEFDGVDTNNTNATVRIRLDGLSFLPDGFSTNASIKLGTVSRDQATGGGICTSSLDLVNTVTITKTSTVVSSTFNNLSPQTYCVTGSFDPPGDGVTGEVEVSCAADPVKYASFCDALFTIGGENVTGVTTLSPFADKYGCKWSGTEIYCPLQPLPGTIDPETKGIDTRQGFGNYLNRLIILFMGVITVLSVLVIAFNGIEYMTTTVVSNKSASMGRMWAALGGLALALGSYTILYTINPDLVSSTISIPGVGVEYEPNERPISSSDGSIPSSTTRPTNIELPSGTIVDLAKQILANSNITLGSDPYGDDVSSAKQNIEDLAAGKSPWTSNRSDVKQRQVGNVNASMLSAILKMGETGQTHITFITGGDHSENSKHYSGQAMDIRANPNTKERNIVLMDICHAAGARSIIGPCSSSKDQSGICAETGYKTRSDHQNHIHCGW